MIHIHPSNSIGEDQDQMAPVKALRLGSALFTAHYN